MQRHFYVKILYFLQRIHEGCRWRYWKATASIDMEVFICIFFWGVLCTVIHFRHGGGGLNVKLSFQPVLSFSISEGGGRLSPDRGPDLYDCSFLLLVAVCSTDRISRAPFLGGAKRLEAVFYTSVFFVSDMRAAPPSNPSVSAEFARLFTVFASSFWMASVCTAPTEWNGEVASAAHRDPGPGSVPSSAGVR